VRDIISSIKVLYQDRKALETLQNEDQVRGIFQSELLDEYTHPRARVSLKKKLEFIEAKIRNSTLFMDEQEALITVLHEEYRKLSMENEV